MPPILIFQLQFQYYAISTHKKATTYITQCFIQCTLTGSSSPLEKLWAVSEWLAKGFSQKHHEITSVSSKGMKLG